MHHEIANSRSANPKLECLLNDSMTQLVMRSDGITPEQVRRLVTCVSRSRKGGGGAESAGFAP